MVCALCPRVGYVVWIILINFLCLKSGIWSTSQCLHKETPFLGCWPFVLETRLILKVWNCLLIFGSGQKSGFKNHIFLFETGLGFQEMCCRCHRNLKEYLPGLQSWQEHLCRSHSSLTKLVVPVPHQCLLSNKIHCTKLLYTLVSWVSKGILFVYLFLVCFL